MSGWKKLAGVQASSGALSPEATSFDGVNDYLNRTSALSGATANKTITASFWYYEERYQPGNNNSYGVFSGIEGFNSFSFNMYLNGSDITFYGATDNSGIDFQWTLSRRNPLRNGWNHVCFSFDLANSSNRYVFINGVDQTSNVSWANYQNANLNWANCPKWSIGATSYSYAAKLKGRLAHLFLDNSYIDLSVSSNLQKFITTDLLPADGQAALNPLVYLPMTDHTTAGTNEGTGGDFTVQGNLAQADTAPNLGYQPRSVEFTNPDYMQFSGAMGSDGYKNTFSFLYTRENSGSHYIMSRGVTTSQVDSVAALIFSSGGARFYWGTSTPSQTGYTAYVTLPAGTFQMNTTHHIAVSIDASGGSGDTSKRHIYIDNKEVTGTWGAWNNSTPINYSYGSRIVFAARADTYTAYDCLLGEIFVDDEYYDLSTDNIFWDTDQDKPKSIRRVLADNSITPLIACPIDNPTNPGENIGSLSDLSVNSAPFGSSNGFSRGGSEYFCRTLNFDNPSFNAGKRLTLDNSDETGINKVTLALSFKRDNTNATDNVCLFNVNSSSANNYQFSLIFDSSENLLCFFNGHQVSNLGNITDQNWHTVLISVDSTTTTAHAYLDGDAKTASITTNRAFSQAYTNVGGGFPGIIGFEFDGDIGFVYQSHTYIDFSDEDNRNLFVNQMSYPRNLTADIEAGNIATPKVYLKFEDTSDFGKNDGTYGDFTDYTDSLNGPDVGQYYQ